MSVIRRRAAILGSPVGHSLSPAIHNAAYASIGLDGWVFTAIQIEVDELQEFLLSAPDDYRGFSVTMPLKERGLALAGQSTTIAQAAGVANTLVRQADGTWLADNTDVYGIESALRPVTVGVTSAAILGSGATTRSALLAVLGLGLDRVTLYARNAKAAETVSAWAETVGMSVTAQPLDGWGVGAEELVVSTLPPTADVSQDLVPGRKGVLMDVVYTDWPTPLARAAAGAGMTVVSGLDMLVHQAVKQFEWFTGRQAPFDAMMDAGRAALGLPAAAEESARLGG